MDEEGEGEGAVPMEEGVNEEMEEGEQRNGDVQMEEVCGEWLTSSRPMPTLKIWSIWSISFRSQK